MAGHLESKEQRKTAGVRGSRRYKAPMPCRESFPSFSIARWLRPSIFVVCALNFVVSGAETPTQEITPVVVTADRLPERDQPFSMVTVTGEDLRRAPQLRLDDILRNAVPGFSLFRRSSSRVANPTTQGVSLRNIGPNGAGRTLVLLDGIPLNDPFAGWVPWASLPPSSLGEAVVTPGGGAGLFGNAALAGTIHLSSQERRGTGLEASGTVGDRDTQEATVSGWLEHGSLSLSGGVNRFTTGGYPVLQEDQRGRVDTNADASSWGWQGSAEWRFDAQTRLTLAARMFDEERNNGTLLTRNATEGRDFSATLEREFPDLDAQLRLQAYAQRRKYRSTFSSIDATREYETLSLDQYDVPANAAGGSAVWSQQLAAHRITAGVDFRWVEGETNEAFLRMGDDFTRERHAGGEQMFFGAFLQDDWRVNDALRVTASARVDYWRQEDGQRVERSRVTGEVLRDESFAAQEGVSPNGRLGVSWQLAKPLRVHGAAYTGFRAPTLNELYRPFRVGNDITEANAELDPEKLFGAEMGADWTPMDAINVSVTGFYNQLYDAIGNVTLGRGPGTFEPGGFVPDGGILRQRQNLDRIEVLGFEAKLLWQIADDWKLRLQYLQSHGRVSSAPGAIALEGRRLAQAPEQVGVAALDWSHAGWNGTAQVRCVGRQYEDDLNTLELAPFATVDVALGYRFNDHFSAQVRVENLFDTEIETGKTGNGLISIGAPRQISVTVAMQF